jgi:hypothetical protein
VVAGLAALVAEHRLAVEQFGSDTRAETVERAAERIRATRLKVEGYAVLLAEEKARLERDLADAQRELRSRVEALTAAPATAS